MMLKEDLENHNDLTDENTKVPDEDMCRFCYPATILVSAPRFTSQNIGLSNMYNLTGMSIQLSSSSLLELRDTYEATWSQQMLKRERQGWITLGAPLS